MSLLDGIIGELSGAMGENQGAHADLLNSVMGMVSQGGGLPALVSKFGQSGLGDLISSWISRGQNLPISAAQIAQVFGADQLGQLASRAGLSPQAASAGLAQLLPTLIDRLTPDGKIPEAGGDLLGGIMGMFGGRQQ